MSTLSPVFTLAPAVSGNGSLWREHFSREGATGCLWPPAVSWRPQPRPIFGSPRAAPGPCPAHPATQPVTEEPLAKQSRAVRITKCRVLAPWGCSPRVSVSQRASVFAGISDSFFSNPHPCLPFFPGPGRQARAGFLASHVRADTYIPAAGLPGSPLRKRPCALYLVPRPSVSFIH